MEMGGGFIFAFGTKSEKFKNRQVASNVSVISSRNFGSIVQCCSWCNQRGGCLAVQFEYLSGVCNTLDPLKIHILGHNETGLQVYGMSPIGTSNVIQYNKRL